MLYFFEVETSNLKKVSDTLIIDSSTLTPVIKKLEAKGYITRKRSSTDERNLDIALTDKGRKLKDKALDVPSNLNKCIDLSESEYKTLYKLIYKVLDNIERND